MVLDKRCPVDANDWQDLIEFLGAGDGPTAFYGGRNRYCCSYTIYTDGTYFYAENGTTGELDFGGSTSEGGASGTSAAAVINAAIAALGTAGGKICIRSGTYPLTTPIVATVENGLIIEGESMGVSNPTYLTCDSLADYAIKITGGTYRGFGAIKDLVIKGNTTSVGGILISRGKQFRVENVYIAFWQGVGVGVKLQTTSLSCTIKNVRILTGSADAIIVGDIATAKSNANNLINVETNNDDFAGSVGIHIVNGDYTNIMRCSINSADTMIEIDAANPWNKLIGNFLEGVGNGLEISSISNLMIGNVYSLCATAVNVLAGNANVFIKEAFSGCAVNVVDGGTNTSFYDLVGYVTKNNGTATILAAGTTIVAAHGCDYTPIAADINIILTNQPTNDIGDVWVDTIGAANFTINCRNVPGVATAIFAWGVDRHP